MWNFLLVNWKISLKNVSQFPLEMSYMNLADSSLSVLQVKRFYYLEARSSVISAHFYTRDLIEKR